MSILQSSFLSLVVIFMPHARSVHGSPMKHIVVMSFSGVVGLTALFVVDMLDLFFLSPLGGKHLAAAVGYAGTMLFITSSLGIGFSTAAGALISRAMGSRDGTLGLDCWGGFDRL
ncbi:hypothetical protein [Parendozoicomonas sp. Alg238-R29]|uniref:hypothetical protein n=1 Tax=Parendozoicomonas sp. Alg238-R29 TaxID=2993446 RepID=UPI00248E3B43|nr:hypothetical protein [Parendozoicomonas sp. Alg238-R29]